MKLVISLSPKTKAVAALLLALLLWVPQGISQTTHPVVTGHSTFYNGQGYDPCLASIAGIVKTQVMWFNDMVLAERYGSSGDYIYITENGAQDPRQSTDANGQKALWSDGTFYDFVDPNGAHWHVDEAYMAKLEGSQNDPLGPTSPPHVSNNKTYVWIVQLAPAPIHDQFAGSPSGQNFHDIYNFLDIVDTCKFHNSTATYSGEMTHEGPDLTTNYGHPVGATPHTHHVRMADIWIGTQPIIVPVGQNVQGDVGWESQWANANNAQNAPNEVGRGSPP